MDRTIRNITEELVKFLPDNREYYRLDELRNWGFPSFTVQRIQVELERNLAESMMLPKTDWANMDAEIVQAVWQQFINAIRAEARLPASYARTVIETAIADVLRILIQPRRNLPEIIFGTDVELSYEQLIKRLEVVVVYRHFASLLPRYMQKKELGTLSIERCEEIIANADERMTHRYSALNWAQMLDPLFIMMDNTVDTDLLRLFFEDRDMPGTAGRFDRMEDTINRARFIEVLSSAGALEDGGLRKSIEDEEYDEGEDPAFFQQQEANAIETDSERISDEKEETSGKKAKDKQFEKGQETEKSAGRAIKDDARSRSQDTREKSSGEIERQQQEQNLAAANRDGTDADAGAGEREEAEREEELPGPMNKNLSFRTASGDDKEDEPEKEDAAEKQYSATDEDRSKYDGSFQGERNGKSKPEKEESGKETDTNKKETEGEDPDKTKKPYRKKEVVPIWKRYLSAEELARLEEQEQQEEEILYYKDSFLEAAIEDPAQLEGADLGADVNKDKDEVKAEEDEDTRAHGESVDKDENSIELRNMLNDQEEHFMKEIFGGSESAYKEAVQEIASKDNWRHASMYIQQKIFKKNRVDMFSEAAVEFTDRLQSYFLDNQRNSN